MLDNIFQKFLFQTKFDFVRIFSHDFYLANLCQYLLSLFFFRKKADFKNACCYFILGLMLSWSRVQQKHPDEKSAGDFQSWESNRGQQWLSRTDQIKIWQGFCLGQNFYSFSREKTRPVWSHIQWRGQPVGKIGKRGSLIDRSRW